MGTHRFVFNIKGNTDRLVDIISFISKKAYQRFIGTYSEYDKANLRLEELLKVVGNDTPEDSPLMIEFLEVCDIIEQYEEIHFPIGLPTLQEMIELRMFEMGLKRKDLAVLLNTSASRISDFLNGKKDIPLSIAKALHQKLNIDGDIILE